MAPLDNNYIDGNWSPSDSGGTCKLDRPLQAVPIPRRAEIVIADDFPFDIEFWQVSKVAIERGSVILVTTGICQAEVEKVGFGYARQPAAALAKAFRRLGRDARVIVLSNAAQMLPRIASS